MERFKDWTNESFQVWFWYGVYMSEEEKDVLFSPEDCKIVETIINGAPLAKDFKGY